MPYVFVMVGSQQVCHHTVRVVKYSVSHALIDEPLIVHSTIHLSLPMDMMAQLLTEVCPNVATEPRSFSMH